MGVEWFGGDAVISGWRKIGGRRRGGCGRHICRPYRVTGTGRRSGQDRSLRCGVRRGVQNSNGRRRKVAGRAGPAPTGGEGEAVAGRKVRVRDETLPYGVVNGRL